MEHIDTWIPKKHYDKIMKEVKRRGESKYKIAQELIMKGLEEREEKALSLSVAFWFLCYSLIVATIIQLI